MSNEKEQIVRRQPSQSLVEGDPMQLAEHFANSGYFQDAKDLSQAVVKIAAGQEVGLGPMASMQGIHIIEGKPSFSASTLATLVQRHPVYSYAVREHDAQHCSIEFFQFQDSLGISTFTIEQAREIKVKQKDQWIALADTLRWKNYPQAMLFARALSQGVRWFCAEVTAGPAYVPEEMGYSINGTGTPVQVIQTDEPIDGEAEEVDGEIVDEGGQADDDYELDPRKVGSLVDAISHLGLRYNDIDLVLGACGLDGLRAKSQKALSERLRSLTEEQADALHLELRNMADAQAAETGSVDDGQ